MYIDSKLFDEPKRKSTYFKNMVLCGGLSAGVVYCLSGKVDLSPKTGGSSLVNGINEEILTGMPPF